MWEKTKYAGLAQHLRLHYTDYASKAAEVAIAYLCIKRYVHFK